MSRYARVLLSLLVAVLTARAGSVAGQAVDVYGRPVAGCRVAAANPEPWSYVPLVTAAADDRGQFRLELPFRRTPSSPLALVGLSDIGAAVWVAPAGETPKLVVHPFARVTGKVLDSKGRPVAGVAVTLTALTPASPDPVEATPWPPAPWPAVAATTDAAGLFALEKVPAGRVGLQFEHPDFETNAADADATDKPEPVTVTLTRGAVVAGHLRRPDGKPVAGAKVVAYAGRHDTVVSHAVTDATGAYRLTSLGEVDGGVCLADPTQSVAAVANYPFHPRPGHVIEGWDLVALEGAPLTVKVVDADTGKPVPHMAVFGSGPGGPLPEAPPLFTGDDGTLALRLPPGDTSLELRPIDLWLVGEDGSATVSVAEGKAPDPVTLKLHAGREVTGILAEAGGEPLAGISLAANPVAGEASFAAYDTSDKLGRFVLGALPTTGQIQLTVTEPALGYDRHTVTLDVQKLPTGVWHLNVPRLDRVTVTGKVVDTAGKPVSAAAVALDAGEPGATPPMQTQNTQTDEQGVYRFERLPGGLRYRVKAHAGGHRFQSGGSHAEAAATTVTLDNVVLAALDGRVTGTVVDAAGQAVAGATVVAMGLRVAPATTAADGTFALSGLPTGEARVLAVASGRRLGDAKAVTGGVTQIRLTAAKPLRREDQLDEATALLKRAWELSHDDEAVRQQCCPLLAQADPTELAVVLSGLKPQDAAQATLLAQGFESLAALAPADAAAHLDLIAKLPEPLRGETRTIAALCLLTTDQAAASKLFDLAEPADEITPRYRVARALLALRLARPQGDRLLETALKAVPADDPAVAHTVAGLAWFAAALPGGVDKLAAGIASEEVRTQLRWVAAAGLASSDAPAAAKLVLGLLTAPGAGVSDNYGATDNQVLRRVLQQLDAVDPAAARALVQALHDDDRFTGWAYLAAATSDAGRAKAALAAAVKAADGDQTVSDSLLPIAARVDPALAAGWLTRLLADLHDNDAGAGVLQAAARLDPDRARLLTEHALAAEPEEETPALADGEILGVLGWLDTKRARDVALRAPDTGDQARLLVAIAEALVQDGRAGGIDQWVGYRLPSPLLALALHDQL